MAFRFTEEDFKRYVKQTEHGGRHIWHELQDKLEALLGVPFSAVPYIARGDRLGVLWFAPRETPRSRISWANQAQFFLSRSIEDKKLSFGLMIECASPSEVAQSGLDPDRDGVRFIELLEKDTEFTYKIDQLLAQKDWSIVLDEWEKGWHSPRSSVELLDALKQMPEEQGWGVSIQCILTAEEAINAGEDITNQIIDAYKVVYPLWEVTIPEADREYLDRQDIPDPDYGTPSLPAPLPSFDLRATLTNSLAAQGLLFTPWQIATFYTALQTKGFVILSGVSGTGKTKLAQAFAALLPQPVQGETTVADDAIAITVQPYMLKYNRLIVPKRATRFFDPPPSGKAQEVLIRFNGQSQTCRFVHASYSNTDYLSLLLRGKAKQWFAETFGEGDTVILQPELDDDAALVGFALSASEAVSLANQHSIPNWIFLPVRPDWRDSKSLIGYYNPITGTYEWTPFLRFLARAAQNYRSESPLAWFVILDEMNLAHVEYYFADLLSVLESGRDADGWTREPLSLAYPDDAEGNLPPRELKLPPNLYVVGTVNVDETTHAFSPKVLDRAFTLELTEADFHAYPPQSADLVALTEGERQALLGQFSHDSRFAHVEKAVVADCITAHPEVRHRLQTLNDLLRPHNLHFGYRVFDEIVAFLAAAKENGLYNTLGGMDAAFDAAVLMKVLPKFHGSRGKLERPLHAVLAWCINPENPDLASLREELRKIDSAAELGAVWEKLTFGLPATAGRSQRMLDSLYTTGFAAFG